MGLFDWLLGGVLPAGKFQRSYQYNTVALTERLLMHIGGYGSIKITARSQSQAVSVLLCLPNINWQNSFDVYYTRS